MVFADSAVPPSVSVQQKLDSVRDKRRNLFDAIPVPLIVTQALFGAIAVLPHRTRFGQHIYAIGGNLQAARFTGVQIVRVYSDNYFSP